MHKTFGKKVAGGLMAAAMAASAATAVMAPMGAFAGNQLGQSTFDDGVGLPWHTCETNPAKQTFDISDGTYNVTIVNNDGPESRWDLQLRHRGLKIEEGHTYKVHWEVDASVAGQIYTKIGDYSGNIEAWHNNTNGSAVFFQNGDTWDHKDSTGDFDQKWDCVQVNAGKNSFDAEFTAAQTIEVAEWAFHYGGKGDHQPVDCFPNKTVLKFDNLTLEDTTSDENDFDKTNEFGVIRPKTNVRLNQIGYYPNLDKKASYVTDASEPLEFDILDSSGNTVYTGTSTNIGADPDSGTGETTEVTVGDEKVTKYKDTGANVHILDFSDFTTPGVYTIVVKDTTGVSGTRSGLKEGAYDTTIEGDKVVWENWVTGKKYNMNVSHQFRIDENIYDTQLIKDSLNYYYQNRSGVPIESQYITSGDKSTLSHTEYGHNPDKAYVQSKWQKSYSSDFSDGDKSYQIDGTGGWYDAGDHGKYVVNGGISVWTLQNAYEVSKKNGTDAKWTDGTVAIPENGDKNPDILDEARVELEWMLKMMVKSDDPYWGSKCEGMVYHKLHDHKWTGLAIHSWKYEGFEDCVRIVKPPTFAASYNLAATAAQAARLWEGYDDAFAKECLDAAKKAFKAANDNFYDYKSGENDNPTSLYGPLDQAIGGGAYGDSYVKDDQYWAACELYATTGEQEYYDILSQYVNPNDSTGKDKAFSLTTNLGGGENNGSFSSFNWGCTSGLGTLSLYLSDKVSADDKAKIESSITSAADEYIAEMSKQGMGIPYREATFEDGVNIGAGIKVTGYEWGSNSFVINNAMVLAYAYDATGSKEYMNGAAEALDYIYGRNGLDFSYVSGYGDVESGSTMKWPHHRFWANGVDPEFPMAPSGVLSGGPGAGMQDPYIGGLGYKRGTLANQKCYVDNAEAWSVNEVTINWNAPLVWMSTFMYDNAANATGEGTSKPTKPTTDPTKPSTGGDDKDILWGDANLSGDVTISDAVLIMQSIANPDEFKVEPQGKLNGDVVDNGSGLTNVDALAIQYVEIKSITTDAFPMTSTELDALAK